MVLGYEMKSLAQLSEQSQVKERAKDSRNIPLTLSNQKFGDYVCVHCQPELWNSESKRAATGRGGAQRSAHLNATLNQPKHCSLLVCVCEHQQMSHSGVILHIRPWAPSSCVRAISCPNAFVV